MKHFGWRFWAATAVLFTVGIGSLALLRARVLAEGSLLYWASFSLNIALGVAVVPLAQRAQWFVPPRWVSVREYGYGIEPSVYPAATRRGAKHMDSYLSRPGQVMTRKEWMERGHRKSEEDDPSRAVREPSPEPQPVNGAQATGSIGAAEGTDSCVTVPDSAEAIVGWRTWQIAGAHLKGYGDTYWPTGDKLTAEHSYDSYAYAYSFGSNTFKQCKAPAQGCDCGIYALKDFCGVGLVFGQVSLWGRVIEGERGYRAQYAYPKRLWVTQPSFKAIEEATAMLDETDESLRETVEAKLGECRKTYVERYHHAKILARSLAEGYGVPCDLYDPDTEFVPSDASDSQVTA